MLRADITLEKPLYYRRALFAAVGLSIVAHIAIILILTIVLGILSVIPVSETSYTPMTVNIVSGRPAKAGKSAPGGKNDKRHSTSKQLRDKVNADQLIAESLLFARTHQFQDNAEDEILAEAFLDDKPVSILGPQQKQLKKNEIVAFRSPHGNTKVKMRSLFGGVVCFEIYEPDMFDEFSQGAWMFTRC